MGLVNVINSNGVSAIDILTAGKGSNQKETVKEMFSQLVKDKKAEYFARIQNGSSEQSIQIGSGSYTETEWRKLLKGFDAAKAKLRESANGTKKEIQKTNEIEIPDKDNEAKEKNVEMLLAEPLQLHIHQGIKIFQMIFIIPFIHQMGYIAKNRDSQNLNGRFRFQINHNTKKLYLI